MRHIVVNNETRIVTHILVWNNDVILPPPNTLIFYNGEAKIGDWWCEDNDRFYTPNKKRRRLHDNVFIEEELTDTEKSTIGPKLDAVFPKEEQP